MTSPGMGGSATLYLLQALLSLVFVVALIYGTYYLLRRLNAGGAGGRQQGPAKVVQSLPLSGGNVLHVVSLRERVWVLTAGPQGVTVVGSEEMAAGEDEPDAQ